MKINAKLIPLVFVSLLLTTSCAPKENVVLRLDPQPRDQQLSKAHPNLKSFKLSKIAVLPFAKSDNTETGLFIPPPKFGQPTFPLYAHLPKSDMVATTMAEGLLVETFKYDVVSRRDIKRILDEQDFSISGMVDPNDAIKAGRLAGADAIIIGRVGKAYAFFNNNKIVGGSYVGTYVSSVSVEMRMIHVETGKVLLSAMISRNSMHYLSRAI